MKTLITRIEKDAANHDEVPRLTQTMAKPSEWKKPIKCTQVLIHENLYNDGINALMYKTKPILKLNVQ